MPDKLTVHLLEFEHLSIFEQLKLEEALIRLDNRNWCVINRSTDPAIVLGIAQKKELFINMKNAKEHNIQVLRRFSGGGCVYVDKNTFFVTFLFSKSSFDFIPYAENILKWSINFYRELFDFKIELIDTDYTFQNKKIAGNAQYITQNKWLHHTSFLWDFDIEKIDMYLLHPQKEPQYRQKRSHIDFLLPIKEFVQLKDVIFTKMLNCLNACFNIKTASYPDLFAIINLPHRKSLEMI